MKKLKIEVDYDYTYYVNHKGEGWNINKTKYECYTSISSQNKYKNYYIFINLYPTYA